MIYSIVLIAYDADALLFSTKGKNI